MATPEDMFQLNFLYPLYLLLIGAGASVGIGSFLAHLLESRRKKRELTVQEYWKRRDIKVENLRREHEIKVEILSKMDEAIEPKFDNAVWLSIQKEKRSLAENERNALAENMRKWYVVEAKKIGSKLNTYFPETKLDERWNRYVLDLMSFEKAVQLYFDEGVSQKNEMMRTFLDSTNKFIKSTGDERYNKLVEGINSNFSAELVSDIIAVFYLEGDKIKRDIREARINFLNVSSEHILND
jgi:hypothetical protein